MGEDHNPKISIIMPVYNSEKYLIQCINSILDQTFTDFELILIDDGSTDNSGNICDEFSKEDKRVIVRHKDNGGICSARNMGLDIARGDYIGFCDNDDLLHKRMYEILYNSINLSDTRIACCYCKMFKDEGKCLDFESIKNIGSLKLNKGEVYSSLYGMSSNDYQYINIWNKIVDRDFFDNLRFTDNGAEDLNISNIIFNKVDNVTVVREELYFWRQHNESVSHRKFNRRNIDILKTYINNYEYLLCESELEYADRCLAKLFRVILNVKYNSKDSEFFYEVKKLARIQYKKYYLSLLKSKYIKRYEKITLSIFNFLPCSYSLFRRVIG